MWRWSLQARLLLKRHCSVFPSRLLSHSDRESGFFLRRHILTVKFISLVNLIADREVVKELVADTMTVKNMQNELKNIIENEAYRNEMLLGYEYVAERLGPAGAPRHAAREMLRLLKK